MGAAYRRSGTRRCVISSNSSQDHETKSSSTKKNGFSTRILVKYYTEHLTTTSIRQYQGYKNPTVSPARRAREKNPRFFYVWLIRQSRSKEQRRRFLWYDIALWFAAWLCAQRSLFLHHTCTHIWPSQAFLFVLQYRSAEECSPHFRTKAAAVAYMTYM